MLAPPVSAPKTTLAAQAPAEHAHASAETVPERMSSAGVPAVAWAFGSIPLLPPSRTIVEPANGTQERPEGPEKPPETPENTTGTEPSQDTNLLVRPAMTITAPAPSTVLPQPVSLQSLHQAARGDGMFVSGPPVGKDLATISAGGGAGAAGYTDWPVGARAPDFDFNTTGSGSSWTSAPTAKATASEGTSGSFYTAAGTYKTGTKEGGKDVSWTFSAAISSLVQTGEQEHCDDFAEAYKISLQEAQSVLTANVIGKTFGPAASKADAENLVVKAIGDNLTHKALGSDKTKWAGTYSTLYNKTSIRDTSGWHSISTGARAETATDVTYDIVKGSSQIGSHASNTIIKY